MVVVVLEWQVSRHWQWVVEGHMGLHNLVLYPHTFRSTRVKAMVRRIEMISKRMLTTDIMLGR